MLKTHGEDAPITPMRGPPSGKERSTAKNGSSSVTLPLSGDMSERNAIDWLTSQVAYENLADNEDIAARARAFTIQSKQRFESEIQPIWSNWRVIDYTLRGNTFAKTASGRDPIHVPEMWKSLATLTPRLEEAVFHYRDYFTVKGRESSDKKQENLIKEFLRWQLNETRFETLIQPAFRLMLTKGVSAFKVFWHTETDERVERIVTKEEHGDTATFRTRLKPKRVVTFNGNKIRLVKPESLIVDLESTSVPEATFIGDRYRMSFDEIASLGEQGVFVNWESLRDQEEAVDAQRTMMQQARGPEQQVFMSQHAEGGPRMHSVDEIWCRFDAFGTGRTREFVITIADDNVVLRVQENPHDDKHRPYAIARSSEEAFRFFSTSPSDLAVGAQYDIDEMWNLMTDAQRLAVCPHVAVDEGSDCPDSFWGLEPGKVFRTRTPPTWMKSPSVINDFVGYHTMQRQNIEEIYGAPRIMQGTEGGNTATEIERKLQEGNKRAVGYVRAMTGCVEQILRIMHSNNQQYIGQEQTFRVLGKSAQNLEVYSKIDPIILSVDVDFEFAGPSNLQTVGMRATNLLQYMNQLYPLLQILPPNSVDLLALQKELYEHMVGGQPGDAIFKVPPRIDDMMPAKMENILLLQGQSVDVHEADDDREHLREHLDVIRDPDFKKKPIKVQEVFMDHVAAQTAQMQKKKVMEAAKNRMNPAFAGPQQMPAPDADRGTTGARGPMAMSASPAQTPSGETPGPPSSGRTRSPDREGGLFQTQNQTA